MLTRAIILIISFSLLHQQDLESRSHRGRTVIRSFHMSADDLPEDEDFSNVCPHCGKEYSCYDERCWYSRRPYCCGCNGAPFYDDSDRVDLYDQDIDYPGKTEATWMRELRY